MSVAFLRQQKMKTLRGDDKYFRHLKLLVLPFSNAGISISYSNFPLQTHTFNNCFHCTGNIICQSSKWGDPQNLKARILCAFKVFGMIINKSDDRTQKNRKCFTTSGRCVYQTTFSFSNVLPGFNLKIKGCAISRL